MDLKKLFIIASIAIIFMTLFCNDTIEGQTDDIDVVRCGIDNSESFSILKDCLEQPDEEAATCGGYRAGVSDLCIDTCIVPIIDKHGINIEQVLDVDRFNEVRPVMEEILSSCAPGSSESGTDDEEVFGVDCLKNCEVYFHSCEVKEEVTRVNRRRRVRNTYGNIEECPNGEIPDQKCSDVEWGCRQCEPGYYVGIDHICKPNTSVFLMIVYSVLFLIFGGILLFTGIKLRKLMLKKGILSRGFRY